MRYIPLLVLLLMFFSHCSDVKRGSTLGSLLNEMEAIEGKSEYLESPYVTAGDRLYMIGHQDGTFPDHGWHVAGEMGGIWDHPIKLMDGFYAAIEILDTKEVWSLQKSAKFINHPLGNRHIYENTNLNLSIVRSQFVPDQTEGIVVEFALTNTGVNNLSIDFHFNAMVDLIPVWLAERKHLVDAKDDISWDESKQVFIAKDKSNPWFTVFGSSKTVTNQSVGKKADAPARKGLGDDAEIVNHIDISAGDTQHVQYYIAGSDASEKEAIEQYQKLQKNVKSLFKQKSERYKEIDQLSKIEVPDKALEQMFEWTKYNSDWLIRDVEGVGRGLSAGLADYPWWFGADNAYSLQGLLATGQYEEVYQTVKLLLDLSKQANGDNGRIIHEASTNGIVFNPGNLNETPHLIILLWKIYEWTGDKAFLGRYFDEAEAGMSWIRDQDKDANGYADGPGMMEIDGLHTEMIDVVVYTQQAARALAYMAEELNYQGTANDYHLMANVLREKINTEWWSEENDSYADFRANKTKTLDLIDAAMIRSDTIKKPWAVAELKEKRSNVINDSEKEVKSRVLYHNWVVNTPMEMGIAGPKKAEKALQTGRKYRSKYGVYVTGLDRDESNEDASKWEVFSYVGAVMTLPTGVQAIAENNYGNPDEALKYLQMLTQSFSYALPGSTYEVSPDYGMMTQAWTIYSLAVPIVNQFFGIQPKAYRNEIIIQPNMPSQWENAKISRVRVGSNEVSIKKTTTSNTITFQVDQTQEGWKLQLRLPSSGRNFKVNGTETEVSTINDLRQITLTAKRNTLSFEK